VGPLELPRRVYAHKLFCHRKSGRRETSPLEVSARTNPKISVKISESKTLVIASQNTFKLDCKMTLCSLCQSIPFAGLPELPSNWLGFLTYWGEPERLQFFCRNPPPALDESLGFQHHSSLEALTASAANCGLCGLCGLCDLISESVGRFVAVTGRRSRIPTVGITAPRTVKPCQADRSGNYGLLELSFSWSCTGGNAGIQPVATSSVDKYGP
jgi:hypothetical protein